VIASAMQSAFPKQDHLHPVRRNSSVSIINAVCISQARPLTYCKKEQAMTASAMQSTFLKQDHSHTVRRNRQ
jgi:hypothetical protein